MPLQLWRPEVELETLRSQMDRMMRDTERIFATFLPQLRQAPSPERVGTMTRTWIPNCDMHLSNDEVILQCELPGIDPAHVEVNTTRNTISIKGEVKEEACADMECVMHERITGPFWRQLTLPEEINSEQAKAQFKHGLLTVRAPLARPSQRRPHKVPIEAGK